MSGHAFAVVPCTTVAGIASGVMGVRRSSEATAMLWPWLARMSQWEGSSSSSVGVLAGSVAVASPAEEDDGAAEMCTSPKRCLSFSATMVHSSGRVIFKERRLRLFSYNET